MEFKYIILTRGEKCKVDSNLFKLLNFYKWRLARWGGKYYAVRNVGRKEVSMHRFIMDSLDNNLKLDVDHINHKGLDNRKINLRLCSRSSNLANSIKRKVLNGKNTSCKFKGVYLSKDQKRIKKWFSQLTHNYKHYFLGRFASQKEAALAYNKKAKELFGDYAHLNKVK